MDTLDWIPVICLYAAKNAMDKEYVKRRLGLWEQSISSISDEWSRCEKDIWERFASVKTFKLLGEAKNLVATECNFLKYAVKNLELWIGGGQKSNIERASTAYNHAQEMWKRRLRLLCRISNGE